MEKVLVGSHCPGFGFWPYHLFYLDFGFSIYKIGLPSIRRSWVNSKESLIHSRISPNEISRLRMITCIPKVKWKLLSRVSDCSLWVVAHQASLSMGFSKQGYWSGLPFSSSEDLSDLRVEAGFPALQADSLPSEPPGKPWMPQLHQIFFFYSESHTSSSICSCKNLE